MPSKRDIYQEVTDTIIAALDAGTAPWVRPWNTKGTSEFGFLPFNGFSRRPYSGVNVFLLWGASQQKGYESGEWYTFNQAKQACGYEKVGRAWRWKGKGEEPETAGVRKGEKSTMVILWKPLEIDDETAEGGKKMVWLLRSYNVFNREQIDGLPECVVEKPSLGDPKERDARIEDFIAASGADIRETDAQGRAFYRITDDFIGMPALDRFDDSGAYYATLLHEMVHWTGHPNRMDRQLGNRFGSEAYAAEELIAEMGSAFLCATFGLDGTLQHPEYVANWLRVLKGDKKAIFTAGSQARKAVEFLHKTTAEDADTDTVESEAA